MAVLGALGLMACGDDPATQPTPDVFTDVSDVGEGDADEDATEPDATEPDATEPDATEPDATEPDATEPDATEPDATEPDATEPDATEPDATEPDATEPDATEPDATEPDATEPDATDPDATDPDATDPDATEPDAIDPDAIDPDATEPDVIDPDVIDPDAVGPDATEPDATDPDVVDPGAEGTCGNPVVVDAMPYEFTGDTTGASSSSDAVAGCGYIDPEASFGPDANAPDAVHAFTPTDSGVYTFTLAGTPSLLYVASACPAAAGTCLAGLDTWEFETFKVNLTAGETYYAFVDGWYDNEEGAYTLTIDGPTEPVAGDACDAPLAIDTEPFLGEGDTTLAVDDFQAIGCEGLLDQAGIGGGDVVYAFTPSASATYRFELVGEATAVYVQTACGTGAGTCVGGADFELDEQLDVALEAGVTYYVVVDGIFSYEIGEYILSVEAL